jgi:hypothetical protein
VGPYYFENNKDEKFTVAAVLCTVMMKTHSPAFETTWVYIPTISASTNTETQ